MSRRSAGSGASFWASVPFSSSGPCARRVLFSRALWLACRARRGGLRVLAAVPCRSCSEAASCLSAGAFCSASVAASRGRRVVAVWGGPGPSGWPSLLAFRFPGSEALPDSELFASVLGSVL